MPVEAMRGNLSGAQNLVYAENNNKAYSSPLNRKNYARNYSGRFIGAKVASSGLKYFSTKTKSAISMTEIVQNRMAVFGAAGALTNAIIGGRTGRYEALYNALTMAYNFESNVLGFQGSIRKFLSTKFQAGLIAGDAAFKFRRTLNPNTVLMKDFWIVNPWSTELGTFSPEDTDENVYTVNPSNAVILKFWRVLTGGIIFYVDGAPGCALLAQSGKAGWGQFATVDGNPDPLQVYNILHIGWDIAKDKAMIGNKYIIDPENDDAYVPIPSVQPPDSPQNEKVYIRDSGKYLTTTVEP